MEIDWRTVQMFLEENGVFEVELDAENSKKVRCSCPSFKNSARCKHTRHVRKRIEENGGNYSVQIDVSISDEETTLAMASKDTFREFIIKYAKVEVID